MNYLQKYKKYKKKYLQLKNLTGGQITEEEKNNIKKDIIYFKDIMNKLKNFDNLLKLLKNNIDTKNRELTNLINNEKNEEKYIVNTKIIKIQEYLQKQIIQQDKVINDKNLFIKELDTNIKYIELQNNHLFQYIIELNNKSIKPINVFSDYNAAGIIFTNGRQILGGYQPNKKNPFISGIGGMKEPGETYIITAIRETLEELFDIKDIPEMLLNDIQIFLISKKVILNGTYVSIICSFDDLHIILNLVKQYGIQSKLYNEIPNKLDDLIFKRKKHKDSEISELCLLPLVKHNNVNPFIDKYFIDDFNQLLEQ
jgi:hypothetical protein